MEFLSDLTYWHWLTLGVIFIIVELFSASVFFLWMGVAALIVGAILYQWQIIWEVQLLLFSVLSIVLIYLVKKFWRVKSNDTQLNNRTHRLIGQTYPVAEMNENGIKVRVNDSLWLAKTNENVIVGQMVKVVDVDSITLIVETLE